MDNEEKNLTDENDIEDKEPKLPFKPFSNDTIEKYKEIYDIVECSQTDVVEQFDDNTNNEQSSKSSLINSTYENFDKFVDSHKQKFSYRRSFIYDKTRPVNPEEAIREFPKFFKEYASKSTKNIMYWLVILCIVTSFIFYVFSISFAIMESPITSTIFTIYPIVNIVLTTITLKTKEWIPSLLIFIESTALLIWYLYVCYKFAIMILGGLLFFLLIFITFIVAEIILSGQLFYRLKLLEKAHKIYLDILEEPEFYI